MNVYAVYRKSPYHAWLIINISGGRYHSGAYLHLEMKPHEREKPLQPESFLELLMRAAKRMNRWWVLASRACSKCARTIMLCDRPVLAAATSSQTASSSLTRTNTLRLM